MRRISTIYACLLVAASALAGNRIYDPQVKSLTAVVNNDWLTTPAVMRMGGDDVLHVGFDELSHDYHRYVAHIERCEADWKEAGEVFESDWMEGFNDIVIDDYERSLNTTVEYTHYSYAIPNDRCRLKMSGNYRLYITDDDTGERVLKVEFMVVEQATALSLQVSTNTDIDTNDRYQQLTLALNYGQLPVTNPQEQLMTVVMQNGREDQARCNPRQGQQTGSGMVWNHCRDLIFDGSNEYRKFEVLDPGHPTMGIDRILWDGTHYQAFPFLSEPRRNYIYDEDADGAFYIRNSDNRENDTASDYVYVNYRLRTDDPITGGHITINGAWTTEQPDTYLMAYDAEEGLYKASILQKLGYYSYQYLLVDDDGNTHPLPSEGNFHQTENRYQALVYFKGTGDRTWRLVGYVEH